MYRMYTVLEYRMQTAEGRCSAAADERTRCCSRAWRVACFSLAPEGEARKGRGQERRGSGAADSRNCLSCRCCWEPCVDFRAMDGLGQLSPLRTDSRAGTPRGRTEASPVVRGQEVSRNVRLRAPPQPGITDAKRMAANPPKTATRLPEGDLRPRLSGVPQPRRSLEVGAVQLASTRVNGQPCKTMSAADSLHGSLSDDIRWRSRTTESGDCVKNAADMLPRRSRLTQMILSGPQRSPAMAQMIANDASLANPQRRAAPPARPISSSVRRQRQQGTQAVVRSDYRPAVPAEQAVGVTQAPAMQTEQPAPEPEA